MFELFDFLNKLVDKYQRKVSSYDRHQWEYSFEQNLPTRKNTEAISKKEAHLHNDLIDVDLIQGSAFPKPKPQQGWFHVARVALCRVLFFPYYWKWWRDYCGLLSILLGLLYLMQFCGILSFYSTPSSKTQISNVELFSPVALSIFLGILHSKIVAMKNSRRLTSDRPISSVVLWKSLPPKPSQYLTSIHQHVPLGGDEGDDEINTDSEDDEGESTNGNVGKVFDAPSNGRTKHTDIPVIDVQPMYYENDRKATCSTPATVRRTSEIVSAEHLEDLSQTATGDILVVNLRHNQSESSLSTTNNDETKDIQSYAQGAYRVPKIDFEIREHKEQQSYALNTSHSHISEGQRDECSGRFIPESVKASRPTMQRAFSESEKNCSARRYLCSPLNRRRRNRRISRSEDRTYSEKEDATLKVAAASRYMLQTDRSSGESDDGQNHSREVISEMESEYPIKISTTDTSSDSTDDSDHVTTVNNPSAQTQAVGQQLPDCVPINDPLGPVYYRKGISCVVFEGNECQKVELGMLDMAHLILDKVHALPISSDYLPIAVMFVLFYATMPTLFWAYNNDTLIFGSALNQTSSLGLINSDISLFSLDYLRFYWIGFTNGLTGEILPKFALNKTSIYLAVNLFVQRLVLSGLFAFLLCVAHKTLQQRLLCAKHFCYLTSSRRAAKHNLPHFRLNKVRNIKTWLTLRSFIKRHGPQHSVDAIVSASFCLGVILVSLLSIKLLQSDDNSFLVDLWDWDVLLWCVALATFLLSFMTLATKTNKKYRNLSVLITEQINLYLRMEQKPHKKEPLMLANNVLKLAEELLKELENPFKISGLNANPYLYNITKMVVLSAFSCVLSQLLGFKLKLYKIHFP